MTRKEEIHNAAFDYLEVNHSSSNVSDCQAAMNIAVLKAYTHAANWADQTIIDKACEWLQDNIDCYKYERYNLIKDFREIMSK